MIELHRILMATDFSDYSNEALEYAVHLARGFGADLYLLHVFEPPFFSHTGVSPGVRPEIHEWIQEVREAEHENLNKLADRVRHQGPKVHAILKEGTPFLEILHTAGEIPADMIVLGTHGRTGLGHVLMGSVAERVVRKAACPVFTVKPKALAGKKEGKGS
ncbi:MAG TPA: universal stress protein [Nitrospiria bacterium]|jgi:nucleotide-binding universal stress UspA family protein|nr:universal stress protein [Nitrospiria bacterium]